MAIDSVMSTGLTGMRQSQAAMTQSAQQVARAGTTDNGAAVESIAEPLINMKQQQNLFDASAKLVKTADETLGTLMDIKA